MGSVRYQLKLAYDGTQYFGFQRQAEDRTVQLVVEAALRKLGWNSESILFAGRTDRGVHADGQIICFDFEWHHPLEALIQAINANLPNDIAVKEACIVGNDFHPRFDARVRTYRYLITCSQTRQPLEERYAWRVWPKLDYSALMQAAAVLPGVYDCAAFGTPPIQGGNTTRAIYDAQWLQVDDAHFQFTISANAFLYHMVRRIVYCQMRIGLSKMPLEEFSNAIRVAKLLQSGLAPAKGLNLVEVRYSLSEQEYQLIKTSGHYHL
ncbi:MAG: tRNA pseudouridine(38-40) synthase TruA [Anaerolineaceae bacterium]|nr:tRNA pseudouridine(38-40) synthase TruA [Anaerolineaceae bacterium]